MCKTHLQYDPVELERQMKQARLYNASMRSMTQLDAHKHGQTPEHVGAQSNGQAANETNEQQRHDVNGHAHNAHQIHDVFGNQKHEV